MSWKHMGRQQRVVLQLRATICQGALRVLVVADTESCRAQQAPSGYCVVPASHRTERCKGVP